MACVLGVVGWCESRMEQAFEPWGGWGVTRGSDCCSTQSSVRLHCYMNVRTTCTTCVVANALRGRKILDGHAKAAVESKPDPDSLPPILKQGAHASNDR